MLTGALFLAACSKKDTSPATSNTTTTTTTTVTPVTAGNVITFAGSGSPGSADGTKAQASFTAPVGIAVDGNYNVYVADLENFLIREINPAGVVSTLAGDGIDSLANGTGTAASFDYPSGVVADAAFNVYVADQGNNLIRKITPAGVVSTFAGRGAPGYADGTGTSAAFNSPVALAIDGNGNLYVADQNNNMIRKISSSGVVTTLAGDGSAGNTNGTGSTASFYSPNGLAVDASGNVYVADLVTNLIRKITPAGVVTTFAGGGRGAVNGTGTAASFNSPSGVAVDAKGNVYVADSNNNLIRMITPAGVVSTFAGTGASGADNGALNAATFNFPTGVAIDGNGFLYVADKGNNLIRKINP